MLSTSGDRRRRGANTLPAQAAQRETERARATRVVAMPIGRKRSTRSVRYRSSLSADAHSTSARSGPAYSSDHRLVDHGQLEVRGRVVDRNAARLGDDDDEEAGEGQQVARVERGAAREHAAHQPAERERADGEPRGEEPEHQRRLGERRDRHVAARAHAAERAAGVERGGRQREAAERERRRRAAGCRPPPRAAPRRRGPGRASSRRRPPRSTRAAPPRRSTTRSPSARAPCRAASRGRSTPAGAAAPAGSGAAAFIFLMTALQQRRDGEQADRLRGREGGRDRSVHDGHGVIFVPPSQHEQQHAERDHVGQVRVKAARLQDPERLGHAQHRAQQRVVDVALEGRLDLGAIAHLARKIRRDLGQRLDLTRRPVDRAEDHHQRLRERGGRVLGARRQLAAAAPRRDAPPASRARSASTRASQPAASRQRCRAAGAGAT